MIILLGVAGSGKSTQSKMLADSNGLNPLSIGELLRSKITDSRRDQMLAGKMLNDNEVIDILLPELIRLGDRPELILDGFPRTIYQANWLLSLINKGVLNISFVVHLKAHKSIVKERLLVRARQDDYEEAIAERFYEYEHTIKPILAKLKSAGINIIEVQADKSANEVHKDIINKLNTKDA